MTESPRRNILLIKRSLLIGFAFAFPLPGRGASVHISFTFSSTMLQCLSNACVCMHSQITYESDGLSPCRICAQHPAMATPLEPIVKHAQTHEGTHTDTILSTHTFTRARSFLLFRQLMSTCVHSSQISAM